MGRRRACAWARAWWPSSAAPGEAAVLELGEPVTVRAPLPWTTRRLVVGADDLEGFVEAVAEARRAGREDAPEPG